MSTMRLRHRVSLELLKAQIWVMQLRVLWRVGPNLLVQSQQVIDAMAKIPPGRN